jgi:translation elongation factor EF-1alpha
VVGEVTTGSMVVALNKCDLIPAEERAKTIKKACKRLAQTFDFTKFAGVTMIPVVAKPGGSCILAQDAGCCWWHRQSHTCS